MDGSTESRPRRGSESRWRARAARACRGAARAAAALLWGCAGGGGAVDAPRPGPVIRIDGRFDDWAAEGVTPTRGEPPAVGPAEPGEVRVADDGGSLYLLLELPASVNLQGQDGALLLVLDADGDGGTGATVLGVPGTDLVVSFTWLAGGEVRHGVAAWPPDPADPGRLTAPEGALDPYALGLWFEPRHTSDRVEIRLARGTRLPGGGPVLFAGRRLAGRVVRIDGSGRETARGAPFVRPLSLAAADASPAAPGWPARGAGAARVARAEGADLRVVSWNVSRQGLLTDPGPARRILAALAPDVVLLDEVPPGAPVAMLETLLPAGEGSPWSLHVGTSGSGQRGVIAARGNVRPAPRFSRVPLPDSIRPWLAGPVSETLREVRRNLDAGAPVTGAWIGIGDRTALAITVDLVCCGNAATAVEDRVRRVEAEAANRMARATLAAAADAPDLVLFGGDFNLVGSRAPLDTAARGLAPGGGDLVAVEALQLDDASNATWDGGAGPFPPGQLDYLLYGGAVSVVRAFVFETRDLDDEALGALGLAAEDGDRASDHRPVVADLAWR